MKLRAIQGIRHIRALPLAPMVATAVTGTGRIASARERKSQYLYSAEIIGYKPKAGLHLRGRCSYSTNTSNTNSAGWKTTIGLELHVQLTAAQKLFSTASAKWDDSPNTNINMADAGLPGSLPRLNPQCIELAARAILGLNGQVQPMTSFDRKHYFYSDQPLGYQITQQLHPIGRGGFIELGPADGFQYTKKVRIHQLQLEQDTAKSIHGVYPGYVLTDLNRAGVALIEIVSEPDLETAEEASCFVRKMQTLLRHIGVSNCNMEEGSIRCDVNVSVYQKGKDRLSGTRCELKNLNSLKVIRGAIDTEVARQIDLISRGQVVEQETRGFDARGNKTFLVRSKEAAPDYRYIADPDIPAIRISNGWINKVRSALPELPEATRARLQVQYGLLQEDVETMINEPGCVQFFEQSANGRDPKRVSSWITSEIFGQLSYRTQNFADTPLTVVQLCDLLDSLASDSITSAQAKQLLINFMDGDRRSAQELIQEHGWKIMDDQAQLNDLVSKILDEHPKEVAGYLKGQKRRLNFFVGKAMEETKGQARPQDISRIVKQLLDARSK
ncbi:aspartyl/glutamyl-tRNA amidotransferase subunit B [Kickxella alabastrina]|uniref:aspartyl/glutamyl-tRNA amidotransferase subunit B n=1 Tax=Kickxella alabastrina TaxID=61397 RepID=UPI00221FB5F0|nr:aspartyl/glutamyl-tRNA amidotransferase subunit B [Kickxella alabastrina]KAI7832989.1 aspartyl/glutamyl-tRNA amidotransferase subunit B [Kickxella alabastrina]